MKSTTFNIAEREITAFKTVCMLKKQGRAESMRQFVHWFLELPINAQKYVRSIKSSTKNIVISRSILQDKQWRELKQYCNETYIKIGELLPKIIKHGVLTYYQTTDTTEAEMAAITENNKTSNMDISIADIKEYMMEAIIQEQDFLLRYKKMKKGVEKNKEKTPYENNIGAYTTDFEMKDVRLNNKSEIKTIFKMAARVSENPEKILLNGIGINENVTIENLLNSPCLMDLITVLIDRKDLQDNCKTMDDYCKREGIDIDHVMIDGKPAKGMAFNEKK